MVDTSDGDIVAATQRLLIRPWHPDEVDRFYDMRRRMAVARWIGGRPLTNRRDAIALLERLGAELALDPRFGAWAVVDRRTQIPAGTVLLKALPDGDGEVEIGWHLHPDSWGLGFATEAATAILARGFALGLDEIWAVTHPDNRRSIRVCQKLGMTELGLTHRWYHEPSVMFWAAAKPSQRPSIKPDQPARIRARA
ncbi:MAG: GNAT family N-acetyltransferase [Solirubrobacteraceae bacterium]